MARDMKGGLPEAVGRRGFSFSGFERDYVGLNQRDGTFLNISGVSGADSISDGRGAVFADFDNDGDYDILMTSFPSLMRRRTERPFHLFRNNIGQDSGWLRVSLRGTQSGPDAFGAVVRVKTSEGILTKMKSAGHGFLSQSDPRLLFGLGSAPEVEWIEVNWPSGVKQKFKAPPVDRAILIVEGSDGWTEVNEPKGALPGPLSEKVGNLSDLSVKVGTSISDLRVRAVTGSQGLLSEHLAKEGSTVISFWASWCSSCARELQQLSRLSTSEGAKGFSILGVNLDERPDGRRLQGFLMRNGINFPQVQLAAADLERVFLGGQIGIPLTLVVNAQGTVTQILPAWDRNVGAQLRESLGLSVR
jgi:thiol-disulfide isomerase/thioredoxin